MRRRQALRAPRGVTLLEVLVVVAIVAIVASLAVPSLTPIVVRARNRAAVEDLTSLVEEARRRAVSTGRCHRVVQVANTLSVERRDTPDCVNLALDTWTSVKTSTYVGMTLAIDTVPAGNNGLVFRPNSRLRGDGDLDTSDDGARVRATGASGATASVIITATGRVCNETSNAAPAQLQAPVVCP